MEELGKRKEYEILRAQLENERQSFLSHWRELGDYILPRRPRFTVSDVNKGERRNQKINDTTPTMAARTLRSGMMSGITSPARPWFRLTTPDPDLAELGAVKDWLYTVTQRMNSVFLKSNLYNVLPTIYGDLGVFGTAAMFVEEDVEDVIRAYPLAIGSYMISNNSRLRVDTLFREFQMTVRQLIEKFGRLKDGKVEDWSSFSSRVKELFDQKSLEVWIDVCHVLKPNPNYQPGKLESKYKRYSSCYYERGFSGGKAYTSATSDQVVLSESGFDYFPGLVPRWEITGEDAYATDCPGMTALGDIKQLQLGEKRSLQAIEKQVNPPMVAPTSMKNKASTILPGGITYVNERDNQKAFRPTHEVNLDVSALENKQQQVRNRISRAFYEDLFLMLSQLEERHDITATEVQERHEEKLLALGPVLEQLNQDLLNPLIDITFDIMLEKDLFPPAPEELHGVPLRVEYVSIMAQAQKLIGIAGIERLSSFVAQIATVDPQAMDKVDTDQLIDVYSEMTSTPPGIVRTDEAVALIREKRQKAQAMAQSAEMAKQGASAAKDLSQAETSGDNALTRIMQQSTAGQLVSA